MSDKNTDITFRPSVRGRDGQFISEEETQIIDGNSADWHYLFKILQEKDARIVELEELLQDAQNIAALGTPNPPQPKLVACYAENEALRNAKNVLKKQFLTLQTDFLTTCEHFDREKAALDSRIKELELFRSQFQERAEMGAQIGIKGLLKPSRKQVRAIALSMNPRESRHRRRVNRTQNILIAPINRSWKLRVKYNVLKVHIRQELTSWQPPIRNDENRGAFPNANRLAMSQASPFIDVRGGSSRRRRSLSRSQNAPSPSNSLMYFPKTPQVLTAEEIRKWLR